MAPVRDLFKSGRFWISVLLTLVVFVLLVKLGFWQLARGEEKSKLEQLLRDNQHREPVALVQLKDVVSTPVMEEINGTPVIVSATPVPEQYILLDNQTYQGQVGYLALQVMRSETGQYFLLERGFVGWQGSRNRLPEVSWIMKPGEWQGRVYVKQANPLSDALMIELTQPHRIQNLNIGELSEHLNLELLPFVLQPRANNWPYPQPWNPLPLSSSKHYGYALQWFAMALALMLLSGWLLFRTVRRGDD